jgi:hypothetical protein
VESHRVLFWALFFLIYMLIFLTISVNVPCYVTMFADDTSVLVSTEDYEILAQRSNLFLLAISEWFQDNQLVLNPRKAKF